MHVYGCEFKAKHMGLQDKLEFYRLWFPTSGHTFHLGLLFFITTSFLLAERQSVIYIVISFVCASIAARSSMVLSLCAIFYYMVINDRRYVVAIFLLIPIAIYAVDVLSKNSLMVQYALEPILNIINNDSLESKSTTQFFEITFTFPSLKLFFSEMVDILKVTFWPILWSY